jgi:hypothetical protein
MLNVPLQLTHDLDRLRDDSRATLAAGTGPDHAAEIEELVSNAVHLYSRLNRRHERWANPIRQGLRPFNLEDHKPWQIAFQNWADEVRRIIRDACAFEERGIYIDQLDILRGDLKHCPYDGISIEKLITNSKLHGPGKGTSGEELRNELQARLRA